MGEPPHSAGQLLPSLRGTTWKWEERGVRRRGGPPGIAATGTPDSQKACWFVWAASVLLSQANGRWGATQDPDCRVSSLDRLALLPESWGGCSRDFSRPTPGVL